MKKLFLALIMILITVNAHAFLGFGKKKLVEEEIKAPTIKVCFYYMEHSDNMFAVFSVFQEDCNGITLRGSVSGRKITEYSEELSIKNIQNPLDDETFREKVDSLWPEMQKIDLETK